MELKQLQYFKMVAEIGNITQSAKILYISPPAISTSITRLEKEIGVCLFDRIGNRIVLNENGKKFLDTSNEILTLLEEFLLDIQQNGQAKSEQLSIFATTPALLHDLIKSFNSAFPHISLSLHNLHTISNSKENFGSYDIIFCDNIDIAKPLFSSATLKNDFSSVTLYNDDMPVLLTPIDHALAKKKSIKLSEIANEKFIVYPAGYSSRYYFEDLFKRAKITPCIAIECGYSLRLPMVKSGLGLLITTMYEAHLKSDKDIAVIPIIEPAFPRIQILKYSDKTPNKEVADIFRDFAILFFKDGISGFVSRDDTSTI